MAFKQIFRSLEDSISTERLETFKESTDFSEIQSVRRYWYNNQLSSFVFEAIAILEVTLRNHTCHSWNKYFKHQFRSHINIDINKDGDLWPRNDSGLRLFVLRKNRWPESERKILDFMKKHYFILNQPSKQKNELSLKFEHHFSKLQKQYQAQGITSNTKLRKVKNGDIIAQLTFGYWRACYDKKYNDINKNQFLNTFKNYQLSQGETIDDALETIQKCIERAHKLRNRASHHEPILKTYYFESYDKVVNLISWLNPQMLKFLNIKKVNDLKNDCVSRRLI